MVNCLQQVSALKLIRLRAFLLPSPDGMVYQPRLFLAQHKQQVQSTQTRQLFTRNTNSHALYLHHRLGYLAGSLRKLHRSFAAYGKSKIGSTVGYGAENISES